MKWEKILYWAPRSLTILIVAFTSLFACDVFEETTGLWQTLAALAIHLLPQGIILIALGLAWRAPIRGGTLFVLLSSVSLAFFGRPFPSAAHYLLTIPLLVIAIMFFVEGRFVASESSAS
jgi:hypothetical protein